MMVLVVGNEDQYEQVEKLICHLVKDGERL